ncbi:hypothetical protein [Staphylococcus pseudintermedius]|uniref:hypothetical protein n=1 Tax=Staphylococcus pseudintermedius TaxID=283734 RepID=UPI001F53C119|nr:hypothetical protein [Staphylococcus pseudintermedius]MDK3878286.1 hypothetical protein [Staphylococcus pseudintermedius]MDK3890567.1 hypothetical protein [Staphylococcus pseudintermedius]USJ69380.1 hypothetical protein K9E77_12385 [Staphylococcus pseudintermedius]WMZ83017.1 hypothetical protein QS432_08495 [Staphylococcus pseudintermedius]WQJ45187.1 hypothetical protein P3U48_02275 [Staphylococcus pseudintermedius]
MKTVIDRPRTQYRKVVFNTLFHQFSKDANFEPIACRAYRPQTKGSVELISLINHFCHEMNHNEISRATNCYPIDLFNAEEKHLLNPFNVQLLDTYVEDECIRIVSKESIVNFRKGKYSVPTKFIGEEVQLIFNELTDELSIYFDDELSSNKFQLKSYNDVSHHPLLSLHFFIFQCKVGWSQISPSKSTARFKQSCSRLHPLIPRPYP